MTAALKRNSGAQSRVGFSAEEDQPSPHCRCIRVGIVDDHPVTRSGLRQLLEQEEDFAVGWEAADAPQAVGSLTDRGIDALILDVHIPSGGAIHVLRHLSAHWRELPVIVYSGLARDSYTYTLGRLGVTEFVCKSDPPARLIEALRKSICASSNRVARSRLSQSISTNEVPRHAQLTVREFEVFLRLAKGDTVSQAGRALSVSAKLASVHRGRVLRKLAAKSSSDLTRYALMNHLID